MRSTLACAADYTAGTTTFGDSIGANVGKPYDRFGGLRRNGINEIYASAGTAASPCHPRAKHPTPKSALRPVLTSSVNRETLVTSNSDMTHRGVLP